MEKEATGGPHKRSCVMLDLPKEAAKRIQEWGRKNIPDEWLTGDGRETQTHVTVLYGIKTKEMGEVEPFFPDGPVTVELGKVSRFDSSEEFDVLKVEVSSDELSELHYAMAGGVENDDSHPEYKAHVTLAYVKKGSGKDLDGDDTFDGEEVELSDLVWSPAGEGDDRKKHVDLGKQLASTSWLWAPWMRR